MFGIKSKLLSLWNDWYQSGELRQVRIFPMGYICNHACPMCWRENLTPEMRQRLSKAAFTTDLQLEDYLKIIKTLPITVQRVVLCGGGEPLLFRDIGILLEAIKKEKKEGHIITNGTRLTPELTDLFIRTGWDALYISVNAATKNVYKIINGADNYHLVLGNIKRIASRKGNKRTPKIGLSFCVQKGNYKEIIPFFKLAVSLGVNEVFYGPLSPFDLTLKTRSILALNNAERIETINILNKAERLAQKYPHIENNIAAIRSVYEEHPHFNLKNPNQSYWEIRHCNLVQNNIDISPDGDIKPCGYGYQLKEDFHLGMNIKKTDIINIWQSKKYKEFRKRLNRGDFYPACHKYCTFFIAKNKKMTPTDYLNYLMTDMAEKINHPMN